MSGFLDYEYRSFLITLNRITRGRRGAECLLTRVLSNYFNGAKFRRKRYLTIRRPSKAEDTAHGCCNLR